MTFSESNVLITGATSGLGLAVSKRFAGLGANTILLCRTREGGAVAVAEIKKEAPHASVRAMICDLASMASIEKFIAEFTAEFTTLDLLFNNAAVMKRERTVTQDGFEMMFQVNYLAPFLLTTLFLEQLQRSATHIVLNNARPSGRLRVDFDNLQFSKRYRMYDSFFQTKLYLLLASIELSQRPEASAVSILMTDPGPFKSALVREAPWPIGWFKNLCSAKVGEAADHILYIAQSDEARSKSGRVFRKRQEIDLAPYWQDAYIRQRLWADTVALIEKHRNF
jgi:NAD(P)-dependent dehydrogenase (short-subunit alcohol dehydrogenase family)